MKSGLDRKDDYEKRREHLANLNDEQLKQRFWDLTDKITEPLIDMAKKYTSPSIERSVLLRMGFNSLEASKIVEILYKKDLLGHGAGNVVYKLSKKENIDYKIAGKKIIDGYPAEQLF
ncbi:MAG TPA: ornithine aminomutase subunit alpha [Exilispira sp.]|nr:ornithine aminomutase subunit alpha [Exilispira sp.]